MASATPAEVNFLNLLTRPLGPRELAVLGLAGFVAMLGYCISHELVGGFSFELVPAALWALAGIAPLIMAYCGLRRTPDRLLLDNRYAILLFVGASAGAVTLSTALTWLNESLFFGQSGDVAEIALARLPLMGLLVALSLISVRAGRSVRRFKAFRQSSGETLALVRTKPASDPALPIPSKLPEPKISLRLHDGHFIPDVSLITCVIAAANYAEIRIGTRVILTRVTMAQLEEQLTPYGFRRIHRSTIVNGALVDTVVPQGKRLAVDLATGERFLVGPSYRDKIIPQ